MKESKRGSVCTVLACGIHSGAPDPFRAALEPLFLPFLCHAERESGGSV